MTNPVEIDFNSKEQGIVETLAKLSQGLDKTMVKLTEIGKRSEQSARQTDSLGKAAQKVYEGTFTPLEKYVREVGRLDEMLKAGKIDQETFNRALDQQQSALAAATGEAKRLAQSEEEVKRAAEDARRAQEELARTGKRVFEQTRTPLEIYEQELAKLNELLKAGKIDQETFNRALNQQKTALAAATGETKRLAQAEEEAKRAQDELARSGKRVFEQTRTPLEIYEQEVAKLNELLKAGKIDQDTFSRAVDQQKTALAAATGETKRLAEAEEEARRAGEQLARSGKQVFESVRTPLERYQQEVRELDTLLEQGAIDQETYNRGLQRQKELLERAEAEADELGKTGKRVFEDTRTPLERYNKRLAELRSLLKAGKIDQDTFNRGVKQAKNEFHRASAAAGGAARQALQFVGAISGIGSVIGGVLLVTQQLRREYDNMVERQKGAAEEQINVAAAQREAMFALGDDPTMTPDQMNAAVKRIAERTGADQGGLFQAIGQALNVKGKLLTAQQAVDAVEIAALQNPSDREAFSQDAVGLLKLQQERPDLTADQLAGFGVRLQQASPVGNRAQFSENVMAGVADLTKLGASEQFAGAFMATLGQGIGDTEGRITRNQAVTFARQLMEEMPKLGSFDERFAALQTAEGEKVRRKLLGPLEKNAKESAKFGLEGESKGFATLVGLIRPGESKQRELLEETLDFLPTPEKSAGIVAQEMARINQQPLQQQAALKNAFQAAVQAVKIEDIGGGRAGISREGMKSLLQATGDTDLQQRVALMQFEARSRGGKVAPLETVTDIFRDRAESLRSPVQSVSSGVGGQGVLLPRAPTAAEEKTATQLERAAAALERIAANRPQVPKPVPGAQLGR